MKYPTLIQEKHPDASIFTYGLTHTREEEKNTHLSLKPPFLPPQIQPTHILPSSLSSSNSNSSTSTPSPNLPGPHKPIISNPKISTRRSPHSHVPSYPTFTDPLHWRMPFTRSSADPRFHARTPGWYSREIRDPDLFHRDGRSRRCLPFWSRCCLRDGSPGRRNMDRCFA